MGYDDDDWVDLDSKSDSIPRNYQYGQIDREMRSRGAGIGDNLVRQDAEAYGITEDEARRRMMRVYESTTNPPKPFDPNKSTGFVRRVVAWAIVALLAYLAITHPAIGAWLGVVAVGGFALLIGYTKTD